MKFVGFNISTKIENNLPKIILEFSYQDEFSDDKYVLVSNSNSIQGSSEIPFSVYKNDDEVFGINLSERNMSNFIDSFLNECHDNDFKREIEKQEIKPHLTEQFNDFMNRYDSLVVSTGITTEGEVLRMKQLAGLLLKS